MPTAPNQVWKPDKLNWWYEGIIDWMLENPQGTKGECADHFKVSASWISSVTNSDTFEMRFAQRREQLNQLIHQSLADKMGRVAAKGLDILAEQLEQQDSKKTKFADVVDVTDKMLARMGYGAPKAGGVQVNIQQSVETGASASAIEAARKQIRQDQFERVREVAHDIEEVPDLPAELAADSHGDFFPSGAGIEETPSLHINPSDSRANDAAGVGPYDLPDDV